MITVARLTNKSGPAAYSIPGGSPILELFPGEAGEPDRLSEPGAGREKLSCTSRCPTLRNMSDRLTPGDGPGPPLGRNRLQARLLSPAASGRHEPG